jgi:Na+:H+ antiporter, NhaA family
MTLLGKRVPKSLRVMILTLAIADDMGAILVIAIGYSTGVSIPLLLLAFGLLGVVYLTARAGVRSTPIYIFLGVSVWLAFLYSGVHATLDGVALGLLTPAKPWLGKDALSRAASTAGNFFTGGPDSDSHDKVKHLRTLQKASRESVAPLERMIERLHPWVSFGIMPLFAFANAGVVIEPAAIGSSVTFAAGLVLGKLWVLDAIKLGLCPKPGLAALLALLIRRQSCLPFSSRNVRFCELCGNNELMVIVFFSKKKAETV